MTYVAGRHSQGPLQPGGTIVRELIVKMSMSLDGFVGDMEGTNRWMFGSDPESKAWAVETTWKASLHIMGSNSFLAMASFWPTSTMEFAAPGGGDCLTTGPLENA